MARQPTTGWWWRLLLPKLVRRGAIERIEPVPPLNAHDAERMGSEPIPHNAHPIT